jgi:hypothetical protein
MAAKPIGRASAQIDGFRFTQPILQTTRFRHSGAERNEAPGIHKHRTFRTRLGASAA